jgi:hypothetical protein
MVPSFVNTFGQTGLSMLVGLLSLHVFLKYVLAALAYYKGIISYLPKVQA